MATDSVGTAQLVDASVELSKMAIGSIGNDQVIDGQIDSSKLNFVPVKSVAGDVNVTRWLGVGPSSSNVARNATLFVQDDAGIQTIQAMSSFSSSPITGSTVLVGVDDGAAVASGDRLGGLQFAGSRSSDHNLGVGASISAMATQTWDATSTGTELRFSTAPNNANTRSLALTIGQDQSATFTGVVNSKRYYVTAFLNVTQNIEQLTDTVVYWNQTLESMNWPSRTDLSRFVAPIGGRYLCTYTVVFGNNPTGARLSWIVVNGKTGTMPRYAYINTQATTDSTTSNSGSAVIRLDQGDYVNVLVYQFSGTTLMIGPMATNRMTFTIDRLSE
eukprot:GILJ01014338.1.p2 GENE.GILJ01014338.1~~GILJ01014338.1.p2  ORF type:complete len:366 (-),score=31.19 GILJ01014338.1:1303-2295(-)